MRSALYMHCSEVMHTETRDVMITGLTINHDKISHGLVLPFHLLIFIKTIFDYCDLNNLR